MKNSCHVGVEDDVFYKLAFFFFLEKRLFLSHKLLQPEAYRKFTLCDCWKLHAKWKENWYCSQFCSWQNTQKSSDYYIKKMIAIYDLRDRYLSLTTARHSSITRITDTSAGTRQSRTGIVHICKSHTYLHTNYLKLAINSSTLCIHVFVVFWSNFNP